MVNFVETLNRSTTLSMFYIACCSVVLMHYNNVIYECFKIKNKSHDAKYCNIIEERIKIKING